MLLKTNQVIDIDTLNTYSYSEYMELIRSLVANEGSTGTQGDTEIYYTKMNAQRMERVNKSWTVIPEVVALSEKYSPQVRILAIVESWCADAAPNTATMALLTEQLHIDMDIILRDENPEIMDMFLTNGTRSIPKFIFIDTETHLPLASWGPRQKAAAELVKTARENGVDAEVWKADLQKWYNQDKGVTLQKEIIELLFQIAEKKHVQLSKN